MDTRSDIQLSAEEAEELRKLGREFAWLHEEIWNEEIFVKGEGCRLTDIEGNTYLDLRAGYTLANAGYGRTEIAQAAADQLRDINFVPAGTVAPSMVKLAAKLAELAPGDLSRVIFGSGGSEANETAIKLAKAYHYRKGFKKRYKVISRRGSYHGGTNQLLSVIPGRTNEFEPSAVGSFQVSPPDARNWTGGDNPGCGIACANEIEQEILWQGPETVAAVLAEPISHSSALMIPPEDYWPRVREICDKYGVILIADEVVNGFGRTGKMFASEHFGLVPDILTCAKGLVSGYLPISAAIMKPEIASEFVGEGTKPFNHVFSFAGLPASCAAALANIEVIEKENLVEHSREMGEYLEDKLSALQRHPIVGDIVCLGLEGAIYLVKDQKTKEPFDTKKDGFSEKFEKKCKEKGLICGMIGTSIGITPPLVLSKDDADELVKILDEVLTEML